MKNLTIAFALSVLLAALATGQVWESSDKWRAQYTVGQKVQFTISGNSADYQTCTVSDNSPNSVMRVQCGAFRQWSAGSYIVYGKNDIRSAQSSANGGGALSSVLGKIGNNNGWSADDKWRSSYKVGDKIPFSISVKAADLQICTVTENSPETVLRVKCGAYKQWKSGVYIVHSDANIHPPHSAASTPDVKPTRPNSPTKGGSGGGLKVGEYACYGSGGRIMIGLGFKVLPGNRYTDLDGGNKGTYSVSGGTVTFRGGHLGGKTGRDLKNYNFTIGSNAGCEPF